MTNIFQKTFGWVPGSNPGGETGNQPLTNDFVSGFFFYARFTPECEEIINYYPNLPVLLDKADE